MLMTTWPITFRRRISMSIVLLGLLIAACSWVAHQLSSIRADQRTTFEELARIVSALGLPPRQRPMIRCSRCRTFFAPELTGCPSCGKAKPPNAGVVSVPSAAVDPETLTAPASAK
jgi:hypothetical protein